MAIHSLPPNQDNSYRFFGHITFDGRHGLPNSVREAMLQAGLGKTALLLDALRARFYDDGKQFTVKEIEQDFWDHGLQLTDALIRDALKCDVFRTTLRATAGRSVVVYEMPTLKALVERFANGFWSVTDELLFDDLQSLRAYREGLHRALIQRRPGIYSRKFLSQRLGVGKRTTRNYDKRQGIKVDYRELENGEFMFYDNWQQFIDDATPGQNWLRIYKPDGSYMDAPLRHGIVLKWFHKAGHQVRMVTQLANRYSYAGNVILAA